MIGGIYDSPCRPSRVALQVPSLRPSQSRTVFPRARWDWRTSSKRPLSRERGNPSQGGGIAEAKMTMMSPSRVFYWRLGSVEIPLLARHAEMLSMFSGRLVLDLLMNFVAV
jgi:hypothetical protein